ncbi:hypothetical protein D3C87_1188880 [compost metagenome]
MTLGLEALEIGTGKGEQGVRLQRDGLDRTQRLGQQTVDVVARAGDQERVIENPRHVRLVNLIAVEIDLPAGELIVLRGGGDGGAADLAGNCRIPVIRDFRFQERRVGLVPLRTRQHDVGVQRCLAERGNGLCAVVVGQRLGLDTVHACHRHQLFGVALIDLERSQQIQRAGQVVGRGFKHHGFQPIEILAAHHWLYLVTLVKPEAHAQRHTFVLMLRVVMRGPESQAIQGLPIGVLAAGRAIIDTCLGQLGRDVLQGVLVVDVRPAEQAAQQHRHQPGAADPCRLAPTFAVVGGVQRD